ncbi:MAG: S41 family peptidase [Brevinematia bacterium]
MFVKKYSWVIVTVILVLSLLIVLFFSYSKIFGDKNIFKIFSRDDDYYYYLEIFNSVYNLIKSAYVDADKVDTKTLFHGAIKGMLESLKDPHTAFLSEDDFKELTVETSGKFGGLGIHISSKDGYIYVISPIEDTPAFREGIRPGDYIIAINGETTKGMSVEKAVKLLRGTPGTKVTITIKRGDETFDKTIVREIINIPTVKWGWLSKEEGIAFVRILQFSGTTLDSFVSAINKLKEEKVGLRGVVFDLRYNPGGLLDEVLKMLDLLIPEGLLLETRGRIEGSSSKSYASGRKSILPMDLPIVVLINEGSASASEIFAGVLQDTGRAVVVGTKSFGKGSVQTVRQLPDGSGIRLTISRYYLPSGKTPDEGGIVPDVQVTSLKLTKEVEDLVLRVEREGYIKDYMRGKTELTDEDVNKISKILESVGIKLERRVIRALAKKELPGLPLFDPDDEYVQKALEVIRSYDRYRKPLVLYKDK